MIELRSSVSSVAMAGPRFRNAAETSRRTLCRVLLSAGICAVSASALAEDARVTVPINADLKATVAAPAQWTHAISPAPPGAPPTLRLASPDQSVIVLSSFFVPSAANLPPLRAMVIEMNAASAAGSVEKVCRPKDLAGSEHEAAYCEFTDSKLANAATLAPGQYRHVASGVMHAGQVWINFSVLGNDLASTDFRKALEALASIDVD